MIFLLFMGLSLRNFKFTIIVKYEFEKRVPIDLALIVILPSQSLTSYSPICNVSAMCAGKRNDQGQSDVKQEGSASDRTKLEESNSNQTKLKVSSGDWSKVGECL